MSLPQVADPANPAKAVRHSVLDGWRGLSVLVVAISHVTLGRLSDAVSSGPFVDRVSENTQASILRLAEKGGVFGVSIFFGISGLLISDILLKQETADGAVSFRRFYLRRAFRILPALLVYVLAIHVLARLDLIDVGSSDFVPALTFTCDATPCHWFFGHLWTLSVEEQFYLAWPILLVLFGSQRVIFVRLLCALALWSAGLRLFDAYAPTGGGFASIALGSLYAIDPWFRTALQRIASPGVSTISLAVFVSQTVLPQSFAVQLTFGFINPICIFLIFVETLNERSILRRAVGLTVFQRLGLASYSIYLWQQVFTAKPIFYLQDSFPQYLVLALTASWLSFRFVEAPLIEIGRRLSSGPDPSGRLIHSSSLTSAQSSIR
ncbi:acyltransferase family protein [Bradyrhizobium sp. HKCCYLS2038]|uniref:acyltransferase family protein n=1 Tax=unclassified Bradyrhizobium TaxID=2631580 RepID=UPI003EBAE547